MEHWLAGLTAAASAWLINRNLVIHGGDRAIIWLVPPFEELLKTGLALLIGSDVMLTHGVFGFLEAIHDYRTSPRWGLAAGLASIVSHYSLGYGTVVFSRVFYSWITAVFASSLLHILWNLFMVRFIEAIVRPERN